MLMHYLERHAPGILAGIHFVRTQVVVVVVVVVVLALYGSITTRRKYKGTSNMDCRERGSYARGVYPTHTSRMGTAKVKQEVGADTRIIAKE